MRVSVLGAVEVDLGDPSQPAPVDLGSPKQRALLTALALHRGRPVSPDQLVDLVWSGSPPAGAAGTLQTYVAGLRRVLEPDRPPRAPARILVTEAPGYALRLPEGATDVERFEAVVGTAHRSLGASLAVPTGGPGGIAGPPALAGTGTVEHTVEALEDALALWRGTPYLELEDAPAAAAERVRLEELRMVALEDRIVAALALGRHATVAAELEGLTLQHPLRERLWALRAVALTRSGRQADALEVLARVRDVLAEELGLEPGPQLRELHTAVLRQDPSLAWVPLPSPGVSLPPDAPAGGPADGPAGSPPDGPAGRPPPRPPGSPVVPVAPWPLVGRTEELAGLVALLARADAGETVFASVVGEPGIGKSRLLAELAAQARSRSAIVLVGRCSQDEGAPPLWPWSGVLEGLGLRLPSAEGSPDESARFRIWDDIVRTVRDAAHDTTLVVLLEDLHWADVSSLRVLGLMLENVTGARLAVVATWRADPPPTGALGMVAELFARRHALRLRLHGLDSVEASKIVESVAEHRPTPDQAAALRERTDGNPFFLLEYARLVGRDGDLAAVLAEPTPPHGVADVVTRRLERLPDEARSVLVPAAVLGRDFELGDVAAVARWDEERTLDALDLAGTAGLVREVGPDRFRFAHALVRDTVLAGTSSSRLARWHAQAAEVLAGRPGREGEVARHWHAAGPGHAAAAWPADRAAAREALRLHAFEAAVQFLTDALVTLAEDPSASVEDEYDVLVELALADKVCGDWINLRHVVHRAIAVADQLDDPVRLARVAVLPSADALWQSAAHGQVDDVVVDALRRALDRLPQSDNELRCRTMLGLAGELYYRVSAQERDALVEAAVAMARRLGDPALLMGASQNAFVAVWRPATAAWRRDLAEEAVAIAEQLHDERGLVFARTLLAVVAAETGDVAVYEQQVALARRSAEQQRNLYALVVLDSLEIPWCAMRGEFEEAGRLVAHLEALGDRMGLTQTEDAVRGAYLAIMIWQEDYEAVLQVLRALGPDEVLPLQTSVLSLLARLGRIDEARQIRVEEELDFGGDTWFSLLPWALAADAALPLADPDLGATAYRLLAPVAGHMASAGSGVALGPVDMYLAMAAAAAGELEIAGAHARAAEQQCRDWRIPLAGEWFARQRDRYGF